MVRNPSRAHLDLDGNISKINLLQTSDQTLTKIRKYLAKGTDVLAADRSSQEATRAGKRAVDGLDDLQDGNLGWRVLEAEPTPSPTTGGQQSLMSQLVEYLGEMRG
jgi:hypothetical protein